MMISSISAINNLIFNDKKDRKTETKTDKKEQMETNFKEYFDRELDKIKRENSKN